jgi:hypothetical protein
MCPALTRLVVRLIDLCPLVLPLAQELEALRAEGKIRSYGLATWDAFRTPPDAPLVRALLGHLEGHLQGHLQGHLEALGGSGGQARNTRTCLPTQLASQQTSPDACDQLLGCT